MGWKWNDAVGGGIDGFMSYGPYGAIAGAAVGGWSKDFDKGLTGDSRAGLVQRAYGAKNGNIGTKLMGNFSGDERDAQFTEGGKFDIGKSIGSVGNMAASYYGSRSGVGYNNPSGKNASISFGSGGGELGGYSGMVGSLLKSQGNQGGQGNNDVFKIFDQFQQQRNPTDTSDPNYNPMEHAGVIQSRYPFIPKDVFQGWLKDQGSGYQLAGRM